MPSYIAILGRQPELSVAELECLYGDKSLQRLSESTCIFAADETPNIQQIGGSLKIGKVLLELRSAAWHDVNTKIIRHYSKQFATSTSKITLGISVYDWDTNPRDIQKLGLTLKRSLKSNGVSFRLIPNAEAALGTATSHHNKLGLSPTKIEVLIVRGNDGSVVVAESIGAQNITALAARDQGRPKRDAFVGMLPPKLALMMVNLSGGAHPSTLLRNKFEATAPPPEARLTTRADAVEPLAISFDKTSAARASAGAYPTEARSEAVLKNDDGKKAIKSPKRLLDPFCGTGVVLQEAALLGYDVYGTDLSDKMIDYSRENLSWLKDKHQLSTQVDLALGDAINTQWQPPIDTVVCETYLGQPFSAPPAPDKLAKVQRVCNEIITKFLTNLHPQIKAGTPLCVAVPAWRDANGDFNHLPFISKLGSLGYVKQELRHTKADNLLYYREDQVVARELLILKRR